MHLSSFTLRRSALRCLSLSILFAFAALSRAASIHGTVTDTSGAKVAGARISLIEKGMVVTSTVTGPDGSFQITTGDVGRFFLIVSAGTFRQLETPGFYAGRLDSLERNLVVEPEWARESIVVTATGTPTPQSQTGAATSVLSPLDLALRDDFTTALRLMPGTFVAQAGQRGAQTSLFVRGGDSDDNEVLIDGVSAGDLGGQFDFGTLSTTAIERAEVYRGPNAALYGADAAAGVVSLTTPHGTTSFPSVLFHGDAGQLNTSQEELEVAGARGKLDYLGAFHWLQTDNDLPLDPFHVATTAGNFGWQPSGSTQLRGTVHYGVSATGVPGAWEFYHVPDNATQKDQDLLLSASLDNQTTDAWHNTVRYGAARRREQFTQWAESDGCTQNCGYTYGGNVTITGANGYSASGEALLDYGGDYPYHWQTVSNRDELIYQGTYQITPHLAALVGFKYQDERGTEVIPSYAIDEQTERTNYDYRAAVHGDFKSRFFYHLGGSLEHYSEFGTQTTDNAGFSLYALKPRTGIFSGTRIRFNFGDALREPALTVEFSSLYEFLKKNGFSDVARELNIGPLQAPTVRTYEGGVDQSFFSERIVVRAGYFHNQFGKEIESVGAVLLPNILPGLSSEEKDELIAALGYEYTYDYGLTVNTEAFRAQGFETSIEGGIGKNIFLRGGYTYLDAVVQRSFSSDNEALTDGYGFSSNGIPLGAYSPLKGARPFRRAPHTGFIQASYSSGKLTALLTTAFASRSDDSTFLAYSDFNGGNSLLLPNRNLDHGYAKVDLGGSYQLWDWLGAYIKLENLTDNQHIAPIGYKSLPFTAQTGLKLQWGHAHAQR